jgi:hypothetical protein
VAINRWWQTDPSERYWLETTDRTDLGVDLNAPQADDSGRERWSYALICEIEEGDVVFHYHAPERAVVAWSRIVGGIWEDDVVWAAHGTTARSKRVTPYKRPGWRLGLEGPFSLSIPVTAADIAAAEALLRSVRTDLASRYSGTLYFPFELSDKRPPRAGQAYLTKFPGALVETFPPLKEARPSASGTMAAPPTSGTLGTTYRSADETAAITARDPFTVDPAIVDRGVQGHAKTQNALAAFLTGRGLTPRSPLSDEPQFDLAWTDGDRNFVAEVKSLTVANEEQQLRLGLGQVLRYRQLLTTAERPVAAVLVVEREPSDAGWRRLCSELQVILVWPHSFNDFL